MISPPTQKVGLFVVVGDLKFFFHFKCQQLETKPDRGMSRPVSGVEKKMQDRIGYIKVQNDNRAFF